MSDVRDPETDQQLPVHNDNPAIQDLVMADIEERKALGLRKYNTLLQANNGRNMLKDAYEEILDLAIYLRGRLEEDRMREEEASPKADLDLEPWQQPALFATVIFDGICACPHPVPVAMGQPFLVCHSCVRRVPDSKLAHKQ